MHGPSSCVSKRSRSAWPLVVCDTSSVAATCVAGHRVALAAEVEGVDGDVQLEPPPLAGGQPQRADVEAVRALAHGPEISGV